MNAPRLQDRHEAAVQGQKRGLDVLLMYEDFSMGLRGQMLFDQVVDALKLEVDFQVTLWRFDLLHEPYLLQCATNEAAKADMVFLFGHGQNDLPPAVDLWFEQWFARRGSKEPCALAVVLDASTKDALVEKRMLDALRAGAGPAGVDVFVQGAEAPQAEWEQAIRDVHWRAETRTSVLEEVLHGAEPYPYRNWGINE